MSRGECQAAIYRFFAKPFLKRIEMYISELLLCRSIIPEVVDALEASESSDMTRKKVRNGIVTRREKSTYYIDRQVHALAMCTMNSIWYYKKKHENSNCDHACMSTDISAAPSPPC